MLSIDTETNGLNFTHGAKPFLVTTCDDDGEQKFWEWSVDPLTRIPTIPQKDIEEIAEYITLYLDDKTSIQFPRKKKKSGGFVFQNAKFDVAALDTIGLWKLVDVKRVWANLHDTIIAGHLLGSNEPHDLTSMGVKYLGIDIEPYEHKMKEACLEARKICKKQFPTWRLAKFGLPEMPSVKKSSDNLEEKAWKNDTWLLRALAKQLKYPKDHPWYSITSDYANADSAITIALIEVQLAEIERRGLTKIYQERLKLLPIAWKMESKGITLNKNRVDELQSKYRKTSSELGTKINGLAKKYKYDLQLPKGAVNNSLRSFCYDVLKLPVVINPKTKRPCLDAKIAIPFYLETLKPKSDGLVFIESLQAKRKVDTSNVYIEGYQRFWVPLGIYNSKGEQLWFSVHSSLNCTGTDTLRWSSNNPNQQNVSRKQLDCEFCNGSGELAGEKCLACKGTGEDYKTVRYVFGPAPGREWWSMDARGIEDRLPAYESGEKDLIDIFERSDEPPYYGSNHLLRFHTVYPDIWDKELRAVGLDKVGPTCKKKYSHTNYQWCKNGGFAVQYGAIEREQGTADRAFHKEGAHALLRERFTKLDTLNKYWINYANEKGYVETIPDRSVDPTKGYPIQCTRSDWGKILPTVPLNYHIQSSAMWWMGKAMVRIDEQLERWNKDGFDGHLIAQIHDEILVDFPLRSNRLNLGRVKKLKKLMEQGGIDFGIPTPVSCTYHSSNWAQGEDIF